VFSAGDQPRSRQLICFVFVTVFVVHSLNYAYFFVDDEAIPFVYAQNVLDGYGLAYNPDDGPVEGYSDFLKVWIDVVILGLVTGVGASRLWAFALAKLFAFACAIGLVVVTFAILRKRSGTDRAPLIAGLAFLTLAGPLAVWSWSGLETTLFALIAAVLVAALLDVERSDPRNDRLILLSVVALLLCRIDGFVWAGALIAPFLLSATRARQRELVARVVLPALAVFAVYHAWRVWYFGELLPMPLHTKVLYKLGRSESLVANDPPERYVIAFLRAYHWMPIGALCLGFAGAYYRSRTTRSLAIAIGLVFGYLWVVGDWMFGFRFFVPLLAPMAILAAAGFGDLTRWRPRAALAMVVIWIAALGGVAYGFWRLYDRVEGRESWLLRPSLDPARFFAPHYQIYLEARRYAGPGDTIAYNQAGFVPFMLSARNIDDLGICTKFYAKLPTTDVVFTEVGRYSPLTGRPSMGASEAYTRSRAPRLLLDGNIRSATRGVPRTVLAGAYRLLFSTPTVTGYGPAGHLEPFCDSRRYLENLAHISHLRRVWINGRVLTASEYRGTLPYLYGRQTRLAFDERYVADFTFSDADEDVSELLVGNIRSAQTASVVVMLLNQARRTVYRGSFELPARRWRDFHVNVGEGVKAAVLSIAITTSAPGPQAVEIEDVRVQGQTTVLKRFLTQYHPCDQR
jgi:hypothetical protein